jgi:cation:H+ antiporter
MILSIIGVIIGMAIMIKLSPYVIEYSASLGKILRVSPLVIGIVLIAFGTSIPEISTSISSSVLGHGDINVGDTMGSSLSQITLIIGLCILISGSIEIDRKNLFLLGSGVIIATLFAYSIIEKGYISRINGLILVIIYFILFYVMSNSLTKKEFIKKKDEYIAFKGLWKKYVFYLVLLLIGVIIGSLIVVSSIISISKELNVPEFLVSFLAVGIGTSLPELVVGITAIRKKEYEIFIGDILGSNIADLTFSLGIGAIFRPNIINSNLVISAGNYLILVSIIVILVIGIKKKINRKTGLLFVLLYLLSFFVIK